MMRRVLLKVVLFTLALQLPAVAAEWPFYVEPIEGRAFAATASQIDSRGFTPQSDDGSASKMIPWTEIRSVRVEPPLIMDDHPCIALIDDDGRDRVTSNFGKVKLRKGLHCFDLAYIHTAATGREDSVLQLDFKAPGTSSWTEVPESMYKKQEHWDWPKRQLSPGFDEEGFRVPDQPGKVIDHLRLHKYSWHGFAEPTSRLCDIRHTPLIQFTGSKRVMPSTVKVDDQEVDEIVLVFQGLFDIPKDGEYRFRLKSDGVAALYLGHRPTPWKRVTFRHKPHSWRASLAYGGRLIAPLESLADGVAVFDVPYGPSRENQSRVSVTLPLTTIRVLSRFGVNPSELPNVDANEDQDVLYATGGSGTVRGIAGRVLQLRDEKLVFQLGDEERTVDLERVQAIRFAESELTSGRPPSKPVLMLDLFGEQRIPGQIVQNSANRDFQFAALGFPDGTPLAADDPYVFGLNIKTLRGFSVYGGGAFSLRDLTPTVTQTALFELPPDYSIDALPSGAPLKIERTEYQSGYAIGPKTSLDYRLGGAFLTLKATLGVQPGLNAGGGANVRITGDGQVLYEREALSVDDGAIEVTADVAGCDRLTIEVDFGPRFDIGDLVILADPELIRPAVAPEQLAKGAEQ